jgi:hypothetical protein
MYLLALLLVFCIFYTISVKPNRYFFHLIFILIRYPAYQQIHLIIDLHSFSILSPVSLSFILFHFVLSPFVWINFMSPFAPYLFLCFYLPFTNILKAVSLSKCRSVFSKCGTGWQNALQTILALFGNAAALSAFRCLEYWNSSISHALIKVCISVCRVALPSIFEDVTQSDYYLNILLVSPRKQTCLPLQHTDSVYKNETGM